CRAVDPDGDPGDLPILSGRRWRTWGDLDSRHGWLCRLADGPVAAGLSVRQPLSNCPSAPYDCPAGLPLTVERHSGQSLSADLGAPPARLPPPGVHRCPFPRLGSPTAPACSGIAFDPRLGGSVPATLTFAVQLVPVASFGIRFSAVRPRHRASCGVPAERHGSDGRLMAPGWRPPGATCRCAGSHGSTPSGRQREWQPPGREIFTVAAVGGCPSGYRLLEPRPPFQLLPNGSLLLQPPGLDFETGPRTRDLRVSCDGIASSSVLLHRPVERENDNPPTAAGPHPPPPLPASRCRTTSGRATELTASPAEDPDARPGRPHLRAGGPRRRAAVAGAVHRPADRPPKHQRPRRQRHRIDLSVRVCDSDLLCSNFTRRLLVRDTNDHRPALSQPQRGYCVPASARPPPSARWSAAWQPPTRTSATTGASDFRFYNAQRLLLASTRVLVSDVNDAAPTFGQPAYRLCLRPATRRLVPLWRLCPPQTLTHPNLEAGGQRRHPICRVRSRGRFPDRPSGDRRCLCSWPTGGPGQWRRVRPADGHRWGRPDRLVVHQPANCAVRQCRCDNDNVGGDDRSDGWRNSSASVWPVSESASVVTLIGRIFTESSRRRRPTSLWCGRLTRRVWRWPSDNGRVLVNRRLDRESAPVHGLPGAGDRGGSARPRPAPLLLGGTRVRGPAFWTRTTTAPCSPILPHPRDRAGVTARWLPAVPLLCRDPDTDPTAPSAFRLAFDRLADFLWLPPGVRSAVHQAQLPASRWAAVATDLCAGPPDCRRRRHAGASRPTRRDVNNWRRKFPAGRGAPSSCPATRAAPHRGPPGVGRPGPGPGRTGCSPVSTAAPPGQEVAPTSCQEPLRPSVSRLQQQSAADRFGLPSGLFDDLFLVDSATGQVRTRICTRRSSPSSSTSPRCPEGQAFADLITVTRTTPTAAPPPAGLVYSIDGDDALSRFILDRAAAACPARRSTTRGRRAAPASPRYHHRIRVVATDGRRPPPGTALVLVRVLPANRFAPGVPERAATRPACPSSLAPARPPAARRVRLGPRGRRPARLSRRIAVGGAAAGLFSVHPGHWGGAAAGHILRSIARKKLAFVSI
uniref:Cadherin domain-containing protein n=1 Tax=Macrostomum lignano TaxID=282301 RepID=A0A1I8FQD6_9PLAT